MRFNDLDREMRKYECCPYQWAVRPKYLVARLDGRSFSRLTADLLSFEKPYSTEFHEAMKATLSHVWSSGPLFRFGYTHSDEMSLLFSSHDDTFSWNGSKLVSVLAAEASGYLSVRLGVPVAFDARLSALPTRDAVIDYFRWRMEDCERNCVNTWAYWLMKKNGNKGRTIHRHLSSKSRSERIAFLNEKGISFAGLPEWQRHGVAFCMKDETHTGINPKTGERTSVCRSRLCEVGSIADGHEMGNIVCRMLRADRG